MPLAHISCVPTHALSTLACDTQNEASGARPRQSPRRRRHPAQVEADHRRAQSCKAGKSAQEQGHPQEQRHAPHVNCNRPACTRERRVHHRLSRAFPGRRVAVSCGPAPRARSVSHSFHRCEISLLFYTSMSRSCAHLRSSKIMQTDSKVNL